MISLIIKIFEKKDIYSIKKVSYFSFNLLNVLKYVLQTYFLNLKINSLKFHFNLIVS